MDQAPNSDPGTHPATAAIIYAFVAFLLAAPLATIFAVSVDKTPGMLAGILVILFQALVATAAGYWGARRHRHGREW